MHHLIASGSGLRNIGGYIVDLWGEIAIPQRKVLNIGRRFVKITTYSGDKKMKNTGIICLLFILLTSTSMAYGKRRSPEPVKEVVYKGIEYHATHKLMGCVEARDIEKNSPLWWRQIYVVKYDPNLEQDVQDVFIKSLKIKDNNLLIVNEAGGRYLLDLDSLEVTPSKNSPIVIDHKQTKEKRELKKRSGKFIEIESNTIRGVVVPKEYFRNIYGRELSNYWTIEDFDFEELDNRLEKYLREEADLGYHKDLPDKFRSYRRQYIGKIKKGHKRIYITFFCESFDNWKDELVDLGNIFDGGDCFFQVEYDIETGKFFNLFIHGEA
ncbi:MAG: hypothetical protein ACYSSO_01870 [Planctomycetota bacterium]|jgi:hypothetical protein